MRRDFVVIPSTSSLADAESMMRAGEFRELPVMDAGALVGIVSSSDIAPRLEV